MPIDTYDLVLWIVLGCIVVGKLYALSQPTTTASSWDSYDNGNSGLELNAVTTLVILAVIAGTVWLFGGGLSKSSTAPMAGLFSTPYVSSPWHSYPGRSMTRSIARAAFHIR
jgi:hypothetical protein